MCSLYLDSDGVGDATRIKAAKKVRQCASCGAKLAIGAPYIRVFWTSEGSATNESSCEPCWADNKKFSNAHGYTWLTPAWFVEQLEGCVETRWVDDPTAEDGEREERVESEWWSMLDALNERIANAKKEP